MYDPVLLQDSRGTWHALWTLNPHDPTFAYASSVDLVNWEPQAYPILDGGANRQLLNIQESGRGYDISWASIDTDTTYYTTSTKDFKHYSKPQKSSHFNNNRRSIKIGGEELTGTTHRVSWQTLQQMLDKVAITNYKNSLFTETTAEDKIRFKDTKDVKGSLKIRWNESKEISDKLLGIFFEDINYAADGGLYAELIQNRGFEYSSKDRHEWNSKSFWKLEGNATLEIENTNPVHVNNANYGVLSINQIGTKLQNEGFGGIVVKAGEKYDFSFFAHIPTGKMPVKISLVDTDGKVLTEQTINVNSNSWKKYSIVMIPSSSASKARLEIAPLSTGTLSLDMVSLFPQNTFKNRKNGLRKDLAQTLADLNPRFVRFPGGCVAHGDGIENMYNWKNTIGPLEARKPQGNMWGYHQSVGLGYFEYFQFCEDLNAIPVPIIAAGVPCQNSSKHNHKVGGQQGGIPLDEMDDYIQDIFDLIEWANGDPKTNKWAKIRADAGHPKPFGLKYIGIGNEDLISDVFKERFTLIFNALKEKYPEIVVIGTAGPFSEGSDYVKGWEVSRDLQIPIMDEHYYQPPGWYIYNQDYYDRYDRNQSKVYLGEYAAHLPGRPTNLETALAEAIHLISCERNGDIVEMTSYAPLLAKEGFTQWNPDLIYFDNETVKPTVGYYIQQIFGNNTATTYVESDLNIDSHDQKLKNRIACSVIKNENEVIIKFVNLLPMSVDLNLDAIDISQTDIQSIAETTLHGSPDSRDVKPIKSQMNFQDLKDFKLKPYSFTMLNIQLKELKKK